MNIINKKRKKKESRQSAESKAESKDVSVSDSSAQKDKIAKRGIRPVNVKKGTDRKTDEESGIKKYLHITTQFLRECKVELKKVKWPTRKELLAATSMVIILAILTALYLGIVDQILVTIIKRVV
jgi:preprotein translocase subunit SecE